MKIAVFGGAFNPPHNEHINMIKYLLDKGFDKVVVVPSYNPPHKKCSVSFRHRRNMLKLALKSIKNVEISSIEQKDQETHYTVDTIPKLQRLYGQFTFVMGGDSLIDMHTWKKPEEIIEMCKIAVFNRGGESQKFVQALKLWRQKGADIQVLDYFPNNLSSTRIRFLIECQVYDNLDKNVGKYIKRHRLYNFYASYIRKLKTDLQPNIFNHSVRTAQCALFYNEVCKLKLDVDKVFVAGLLHDCAKQLVEKNKYDVPKDSIGTPVEHQFAGKEVAKHRYGITDDDVLKAIEYHTTGRDDMSVLQKLIFCADKLEEARDYKGIEQLRQTIYADFEQGFFACLKHHYEYILQKNKSVYPLTKIAVEFYKEKK